MTMESPPNNFGGTEFQKNECGQQDRQRLGYLLVVANGQGGKEITAADRVHQVIIYIDGHGIQPCRHHRPYPPWHGLLTAACDPAAGVSGSTRPG